MPKHPTKPSMQKKAASSSSQPNASGARHPCIRVYGACNYGEGCKFALYPRAACLRYLKGTCVLKQKDCPEIHVDSPEPAETKTVARNVAVVRPAVATKNAAPARPAPLARGSWAAAVTSTVREQLPPPPPPVVAATVGATTHARDLVLRQLQTVANLSFARHPCVRIFGRCEYGDACSYAEFPRAMCLSFLKKLWRMDAGGDAKRCDLVPCTDPHGVKEASRLSMTASPHAPPKAHKAMSTTVAAHLLSIVTSDADIAGMPKHPCLREFQGACTAALRLGCCHFENFPRDMCLRYLKQLFEVKKSSYDPNSTSCGIRGCKDCHSEEDLRRAWKRYASKGGGGRAQQSCERGPMAITIGDFAPEFKFETGRSYASVIQTERGKRVADASSVLARPLSNSSAAVTSTGAGTWSADDDAYTGDIGYVGAEPCATPYEALVQQQGVLSDGQSLQTLEVFPVACDFTHGLTDNMIVELLPAIEVHRPIDPSLQKHHLTALYFNGREDFVASLRRAVRLIHGEWYESQHIGRAFSWSLAHNNDEHHDLRHYQDVTFQGGQMTPAGLVFHLHIDLASYGRRVRWERRLLNGALLLLSFNDFWPYNNRGIDGKEEAPEILMATIVKTHTTDDVGGFGPSRKQVFSGDIDVSIINITPARRIQLLQLSHTPVCVLESPVFFLPYQQSLNVVKSMTALNDSLVLDGLLLSQHPPAADGVGAGPPKFLAGKTLDLSLVLAGRVENNLAGVPLLFSPGSSSHPWPKANLAVWSPETEDAVQLQNLTERSHLHVLDDTQAQAMEHLLSAKVAIVQGPPGTGKTFIGEKYIQTLYHNRRALTGMGPILLACETNHAVDSMLNGVRLMMGDGPFLSSVVRLGARSKDPTLQQIQLNSLTQSQRTQGDASGYRNHWRRAESAESQLKTLQEVYEHLEYISHKAAAYPKQVAPVCLEFDNTDVCERIISLHIEDAKYRTRWQACEHAVARVNAIVDEAWNRVIVQGEAEAGAYDNMVKRKQDVARLASRLFPTPDEGKKTLAKVAAQASSSHIKKLEEQRNRMLRDLDVTRRAYEALLSTHIPWDDQWMHLASGDTGVRRMKAWIAENRTSLTKRNAASEVQLFVDDIDRKVEKYVKWSNYYQRCLTIEAHQEELRAFYSGDLERSMVEIGRNVSDFYRIKQMSKLDAACIHLGRKLKQQESSSQQAPPSSPQQPNVTDAADDDFMDDDCALRAAHNSERDIGDFIPDDIKRLACVENCNPLIMMLMQPIKAWIDAVMESYCTECDSKRSQDILKTVGLLQGKFILAGTISSVTREAAMLRYLRPKIVMIEEAAEVREESIWSCLTHSTEQLVLIGDHMQLSPKIQEDRLKRNGFGVSLMERLVYGVGAPVVTITTQRRMHPDISACVKGYYHRSNIRIEDHRSTESRPLVGTTRGSSQRVVFISCDGVGVQNESGSWKNDVETLCAVRLARLLRDKHPKQSIVILTMYRGQLLDIQKKALLEGLRFGAVGAGNNVRIATVDDFQGEESDIVVLSPVRTPRTGMGYLFAENRWCVALSRARAQMFIVGSTETLSHKFRGMHEHVLYDFSSYVKNPNLQGALYVPAPSALPVQMCGDPSHVLPWTTMASPIIALPTCKAQCSRVKRCGHNCTQTCHSHRPCDAYPCDAPCKKTLQCGHACGQKCFKPCGPCTHLRAATCSRCDRPSSVQCRKISPESGDFDCAHPCLCRLPCGHPCMRTCGNAANAQHQCDALVSKHLPRCGHPLAVPCGLEDLSTMASQCKAPCEAKLECGHACPGKCGSCYDKMRHVDCAESVVVRLPCGHERETRCSEPLPRCDRAEGCGLPTEPARRCAAEDALERLGKLQEAASSIPVFDTTTRRPCETLLSCGHVCLGLLGAPCPSYCALCPHDWEHPDAAPLNLGTQVLPGTERRELAALQRTTLAGGGAVAPPTNEVVSKCLVQAPCCSAQFFVGDLQAHLRANFDPYILTSIPCFACGAPVVPQGIGSMGAPVYPLCEAYTAELRALRCVAGAAYAESIKKRCDAKQTVRTHVAAVAQMLTGMPLEELESSFNAPVGINIKKPKTKDDKEVLAELRKKRSTAMESTFGDALQIRLRHHLVPTPYAEAMTALFMIAWRVKEEFVSGINDRSANLVDALCRAMRLAHYACVLHHCSWIGARVHDWVVRLCTTHTAVGNDAVQPQAGSPPALLSPQTIVAAGSCKGGPHRQQLLQEILDAFLMVMRAAWSVERMINRQRVALRADGMKRPNHVPKDFPALSDDCLEAVFERCRKQIGEDGFVRNRGTATFVKNQCLLTACSAFQRFASGVVHDVLEQHQRSTFEEWILDHGNTAVVYHGTAPKAIAAISCRGFDTERRRRQAFGTGEYFGKTMETSHGYVRDDGEEMLVCLIVQPTVNHDLVDCPPDQPTYVVAKNTPDRAYVVPVGVVDYQNDIQQRMPGMLATQPHRHQQYRANSFQFCDYPATDGSDDSAAQSIEDLVDVVVAAAPLVPSSAAQSWRIGLKEAMDAVPKHCLTNTAATPGAPSPVQDNGSAVQDNAPQVHFASEKFAQPDAHWYVCLKHTTAHPGASRTASIVLFQIPEATPPTCPVCCANGGAIDEDDELKS